MSSTSPPSGDIRRTTPGAGVARTASIVGAVLALLVTVIHIADQGGITALKDPAYLGYGYWVLELAGIVCAVLLIRSRTVGWVLALGVAAGPLIGIIVSRSVGLPDATDDIGNWGEPLGVAAMVVEVALIGLAAFVLSRRGRKSSPTPTPA